MTQTVDLSVNQAISTKTPSLFKRITVFSYGVIAYTVGCTGLFWLILALGDLAPSGFSFLQTQSVTAALLVNTGLIILFGIQHSVMARARFKSWLTRYIPQAAERATFMLMSGATIIAAIYFWQPIPGVIWSIENTTAQIVLWGLYALGWTYLLLSTFVTNHFELMGLRQVYLYLVNKPYTSLPFSRKYMYRYSRHPMMLGLLVGLWAIPVMTLTHFVMAMLLTCYMIIGVALEERDLMKVFGETYRNYKQEIAMLIPKVF